MSEGKERKISTRWILVLMVVLPLAVWIGAELGTGRTIWYMRVADALDMAIIAPLYTAIMIFLWFRMLKAGAPTVLLVAFAVMSIIFMYGHAMHATANAINTFATEVRDYRDILPDDLYQLIYFLDERLSHIILFAAVTGLVGSWLAFDRLALAPPLLPGYALIILGMGVIYGFVQAYALIEARTVWLIFPMTIALAGLWLWYWRRSGLSFSGYFRDRPFTTFVALLCASCVVVMIVYGIVFDGFPQPSELGFMEVERLHGPSDVGQ
jgi:hypothetical protein